MKKAFVITLAGILLPIAHADEIRFPPGTAPPGVPSSLEAGKVTYVPSTQLPPEAKALVEQERIDSERGFELLDEQTFQRRENYRDLLRQDADVKPLLRMKLSAVEPTPLASYAYEGIIPDGPAKSGPWTSVVRVFKRPDGVPIFLSEWDYVTDGGAILIAKDLINAKVLDKPARLVLKKSNTGAELTELAWASDRTYYTLSVWDDVSGGKNRDRYGIKWLTEIAEKLQ